MIDGHVEKRTLAYECFYLKHSKKKLSKIITNSKSAAALAAQSNAPDTQRPPLEK